MNGSEALIQPGECLLLLVDMQAGLGFGTESISRQVLLNNAVDPSSRRFRPSYPT
jgi:hypothetical protein